MQRTTVQECCRWGYGTSPVLIVAPHGGRRLGFAPRPRRPLKVNDLHTAELACELARTLDASYVVNGALDRNDVDLNRTSQTVRAAPWFLDRLESMIGEILRRHAAAEVLFVHGWNVVEPKCDIGIGARLSGEAEAARSSELLTVSERYVEQRLGAFRADCRRIGIHATFGERYPARHPDNVLQLFRRHRPDGAAAAPEQLRQWIRDGRVQAVQLELGMPLRWPGSARERFVACAAAAFGGEPAPAGGAPRHRLAAPLVQRPIAFQFYDPDRDLALLSSISVSSSGDTVGSRLLLLDECGLELFLGEGRAPDVAEVGGLRIAAAGGEVRLDFDGWLLGLADPELYIDIEHAFAASRLLAGRAELVLRPISGGRYGMASGWIEREGRRIDFSGFGFADASLLHRPFELGRSHLSLSASLGSAGACVLRAGTGHHRFVRITAGGEVEHRHGTTRVDLAADRATPERFEVHFAGEPALTGEPCRRVAIHRSLPGGRTARTTFGVARFRQGSASGFGFYDYSCLLGRA